MDGQFIMPPWSLEEMLRPEVMKLHGIDRSVVEERFGRFGGSARHVLAQLDAVRAVYDRKLEERLNDPEALSYLDVPADLRAISKVTHMFVKLLPVDDGELRLFGVQLASDYIKQELVKRNFASRTRQLWERIRNSCHTAIASALYEEAWHQFVQLKEVPRFELECRRLKDGTVERRNFSGGLEGMLVRSSEIPGVIVGRYYQPLTTTFKAVDSWSSDGLFQVTIAAKHDIKLGIKSSYIWDVLDKMQQVLKIPLPFYFIVPKERYLHAYKTVQNVTGKAGSAALLEQWVCCFDEQDFRSS